MTKKQADKAKLHDLHQKYYGKKTKKPTLQEPIAPAKVDPIAKDPSPKDPDQHRSKAELMDLVKQAGVKNYRILNRAECIKVLELVSAQTSLNDIAMQVVAPAIERWKDGWGSKGPRTAKPAVTA